MYGNLSELFGCVYFGFICNPRLGRFFRKIVHEREARRAFI